MSAVAPTTTPSRRELAMLRAVAAGRAEITTSCEPDLFIDGLSCCDQSASHRLAHAGLVRATTSADPGQLVPAELTELGHTLVEKEIPVRKE